jgi:hypothetical protein
MNQIQARQPWDKEPTELASYQNGNCTVRIMSDGTKVRSWDGVAAPVFPESVDLKITGYCDNSVNCPFCHEMSNLNGKHGDLDLALRMWEGLPAGVEIAIGGGNPLSHPGLIPFLEKARERGHVCNLTINQMHLEPFRDMINYVMRYSLIKGVGVSVRDMKTLHTDTMSIWPADNLVYHMILGLNTWDEFAALKDRVYDAKVLLLGYKTFGWGIKYGERHSHIKDEISNWRRQAGRLFKTRGVTSFDNLAIEQLDLRRWFSPDSWKSFYMGDDGSFTMYVDVVKKEYARGSTATDRRAIGTQMLSQCFADVRRIEA